ncbi:hypothetical protein HZC09_05545 [Candidatus Micrarchaeota archaeon]|nr:hypothetical protein [Candidatus Micrarchaeota archaeon]
MPTKLNVVDDIKNQLRTLDSKINLLVQKLKTIEKNQEILSQTLLKVKQEVKEGGGKAAVQTGASSETEEKIKELESEVKQIRYVIDSINPLEYATIDQVKELLEEKCKK